MCSPTCVAGWHYMRSVGLQRPYCRFHVLRNASIIARRCPHKSEQLQQPLQWQFPPGEQRHSCDLKSIEVFNDWGSSTLKRFGVQHTIVNSARSFHNATISRSTSSKQDPELQSRHNKTSQGSNEYRPKGSLSSHSTSIDCFSGDFIRDVSSRPKDIAIVRFEDMSSTRRKVDLSYLDVRKREALTSELGLSASSSRAPTVFRNNTGLRRILSQYIEHIAPILENPPDEENVDHQLDHWLPLVFDKKTITFMEEKKCSVQDVVAWAWVLQAVNPGRSIRRYVALAHVSRSTSTRAIPLFVPLQILRAPRIDSSSLHHLMDEIEACLNNENRWGNESGVILLIRLLRHARLTDPNLYPRIADLAPRILRSDDTPRLSHFYNRFLSLIALPLAKAPFLSVTYQQQAQLSIIRTMTESDPQLFLNREGYRALARLQVMHSKTPEEQRWSSVKGHSWPPWRRDQLGIDASIVYPGRQSRVSRMIRRLLEAGYGPESLEMEARIMAGWDTDKSPTIQTRRIMNARPLSWIKSLLQRSPEPNPPVDHRLWAARVAATRSVREAWVCFYSYMQATLNMSRQMLVYHEMFNKLYARVQQTDQRLGPYPGDGKEVFPNPTSPRDMVYVPQEPPTADELYAQMQQDNVQAGGRLLALLMNTASSLTKGLGYLEASSLAEVKKDVLLHPEKYPAYFTQSVLSTLPEYLLASYIGLLAKSKDTNATNLYAPASWSAEEGKRVFPRPVRQLRYAMLMLDLWKPAYAPAYHVMLEGLCIHSRASHAAAALSCSRQYSPGEIWTMVDELVKMMDETQCQPDLICFRKLVVLIRNLIIRAPTQLFGHFETRLNAVKIAKSLFASALCGSRLQVLNLPAAADLETHREPYWKDVEALILLLGYGGDFDAILKVLEWLRDGRTTLRCISDEGYTTQRIICAARTALELRWLPNDINIKRATQQQIDQAKQLTSAWTWPEVVDIDDFKKQHVAWFGGMNVSQRCAY